MEDIMASTGHATLTVGMLALTLFAVYVLRNWLAGLMWGVSTITLIFAGLFGVGVELFWLSLVATLVLLMAGMVVRML